VEDLPIDPPPPQPPLLAAPPTPAAAPASALGSGARWAIISGETAPVGHDLLSAEFGFPGLSFGYAHALSDRSDWGAKFDMVYGLYSTTTTQFGMQVRLPLRLVAARKDKVSLLLHLDPALFLYVPGKTSVSLFGASVTPGAQLGFQVLNELRLALCFDLPLTVQVLHGGDFVIGPQFGFGAEYFIDDTLSVGLNLRFGPVFVPTTGGDASLGFLSQVSIGKRL
jgi:hypothetical protein